MDRIFVVNLVIKGKHGVSDRERSSPQEFQVDISVDTDTKNAVATDDISDAVNYKEFVDIARTVIEGPSCHLIETLAHRIAIQIHADKRVGKVSVTIRKPHVLPVGVPGVTIVRER